MNSAARRMPSARARAPASPSAPRPNVTRDASTVNAVSQPASIAASAPQVMGARLPERWPERWEEEAGPDQHAP